MGPVNLAEWQKLPISLSELCINTTLRCGQSFRWRKSDAGIWSIALYNRIISLHQDPDHLYYRTFPAVATASSQLAPPTPPASQPPSLPDDSFAANANYDNDTTLELINHYFNLSHDLSALYAAWSAADANFARKAPRFTGVRILQQPAWEALIGFICSSNNNIARITQMVRKLCLHYGPLVGRLDADGNEIVAGDDQKKRKRGERNKSEEEAQSGVEAYHDFPTPAALARPGVEAHLRELGFGYRAKYIYQTACMVAAKPDGWLDGLRNGEAPAFGGAAAAGAGEEWQTEGRDGYRAAHAALLELQGVGPKVADCVCLMGLGWGEAVPVDTHVWQIAVRDYRFGGGKGGGKNASMTRGLYDAVGNKFRALWGKQAGWAHSVLFTADLRAFSERLVAKSETVSAVDDSGGDRVVKTEKVLEKVIKREQEDEERKVIEVESSVRRSKRRRRS